MRGVIEILAKKDFRAKKTLNTISQYKKVIVSTFWEIPSCMCSVIYIIDQKKRMGDGVRSGAGAGVAHQPTQLKEKKRNNFLLRRQNPIKR